MTADTPEASALPSLGRLADLIGFRLRRVQYSLSRAFSAAAAEHELRSGMISALTLIGANPGIAQGEVARIILQDKSATVLIIDALERRGLAERRRTAADKRRHALYITPAGEAFRDRVLDVLSETEDRLLKTLTAEELRVLNRVLDKLLAACLAAD